MRAFILAVTGLVALAVAACSSYGTSVVEVEKQKPQVASVLITLLSPSLVAGQTQRASVAVKDANGIPLTDRAVVWFTSAASVATVTDSGVILGVSPGPATVSAVSDGVAGQAAMTVIPRPPIPVAKVLVVINPAVVVVGQTAHATVALQDSSGNPLADRPVTWQSDNPSVASVSGNGDISAVAPGTAAITAASEGKTASASLSVSAPAPIPVTSVSVLPASASLQVGASAQLSAVTRDANGNVLTGRVISWTSGNTAIATVSGSGLVTAAAAGSVSVTASSEGQSGSAAITVSAPAPAPAPAPVASVSVSPTTSSLQVGGTVQLSAVTRDANNNVLTGRVITWSSSSTGISAVSASGLVTAIAAGSATITASSETKTGTAAITVSAPAPVPVASVSVTPATATAQVGGTVQFSAVTRDANNNILTGRSIAWSSNNPAVATVSASGRATAVAAGSAQITATSELQSGSATLTVTSAPPPPPPPPSGWRGNEPAGMTVIDERPFNTMTEGDSPHVPFWFRAGGSIASDATAPQSAPNVLRATYPAGFVGGSSTLAAGVEAQGISSRTFYASWWAKYSSNWYGHLTGVNKQSYFGANGSAGQAFFEVHGVGNNPLVPQMVLQSGLGTDATFRPNLVPSAVVPRNQWFYVEVVLVGNTSGNSDGSFDWYLNGVHVGSARGLQITTSATRWDRFNLDPIWGGAGDIAPVTMTLDIDHVYLSGKN